MFSTIVIGLDPSETAQRACETGVELAKELGAQVHLVSAFSDSSSSGDETTAEQRAAADLLEATAASCGLADGANWAIRTIVNKYWDEFEAKVSKQRFVSLSVVGS